MLLSQSSLAKHINFFVSQCSVLCADVIPYKGPDDAQMHDNLHVHSADWYLGIIASAMIAALANFSPQQTR